MGEGARSGQRSRPHALAPPPLLQCADRKWCPLGLWCLARLASRRRCPPMALCCLSPVSLSVSVTGSSCQSVSALLRTVSARLGQECIYSMFCFLCQRQSVRNMAQVSIFLGAFPEKCSIWLLAQGSCAAPASSAAVRSCGRPRKMLL